MRYSHRASLFVRDFTDSKISLRISKLAPPKTSPARIKLRKRINQRDATEVCITDILNLLGKPCHTRRTH